MSNVGRWPRGQKNPPDDGVRCACQSPPLDQRRLCTCHRCHTQNPELRHFPHVHALEMHLRENSVSVGKHSGASKARSRDWLPGSVQRQTHSQCRVVGGQWGAFSHGPCGHELQLSTADHLLVTKAAATGIPTSASLHTVELTLSLLSI